MRSDNDAQARSAFLELNLHESLVRGGHDVTIHPELPHTTRRPDFLAERGSARVYVEAIAPGTSLAERSKAARMGALLAALDKVGDSNFMLVTKKIDGADNSAPSTRIRQRIREWLAGLDPDAVQAKNLPELTVEQDGWRVTVEAMPIRSERRGKVRRSIGVYAHHEVQFIDDGPKLVAALKTKESRYGDFDAPYVIAVGTNSFDEDDEEVFDALYGSVGYQLHEGEDGEFTTRAVRHRDGYFGFPGAWKSRRVSGVLIVDQMPLHDPTKARVALWLHPDPLHPLPSEPMFPGVIRRWREGVTEELPGLDARSLLGLAEDWPQGERWK